MLIFGITLKFLIIIPKFNNKNQVTLKHKITFDISRDKPKDWLLHENEAPLTKALKLTVGTSFVAAPISDIENITLKELAPGNALKCIKPIAKAKDYNNDSLRWITIINLCNRARMFTIIKDLIGK